MDSAPTGTSSSSPSDRPSPVSVDNRIPDNRLPNAEDISSSEDRCGRRWTVLHPFMAVGAIAAELGVFKGNFVDYILATGPARLYLVDPWYRIAGKWNWVVGDRSPSNALAHILTAYHAEIDSGLIEPRIQFSHEFFSSMPEASLDWVYIDTDHRYETTKAELALAVLKVKPAGYIMGDDYDADPAGKFYGVWRAVSEFVQAGLIELVVDGTERQFVAQRL